LLRYPRVFQRQGKFTKKKITNQIFGCLFLLESDKVEMVLK